MARIGVVLNLVGVLVIATVFYFLGLVVFGIESEVKPERAILGTGGA